MNWLTTRDNPLLSMYLIFTASAALQAGYFWLGSIGAICAGLHASIEKVRASSRENMFTNLELIAMAFLGGMFGGALGVGK